MMPVSFYSGSGRFQRQRRTGLGVSTTVEPSKEIPSMVVTDEADGLRQQVRILEARNARLIGLIREAIHLMDDHDRTTITCFQAARVALARAVQQ